MNNNEIKIVQNKKSNIILIFLAVLLTVTLGWYIFTIIKQNDKKISKDNIEITAMNNGKKVEITVKNNDENFYIVEYSFDGGKTWQTSNTFITADNKDLDIVLKDANKKIVYRYTFKIDNLDHDGPVIDIKLPDTIYKDDYINVNEAIKASDISGLNGNIILSPEVIDTSSVGTKTYTVIATDKLGNSSSLSFDVVITEPSTDTKEVIDTGDKTSTDTKKEEPKKEDTAVKQLLYRYRTKTISSYECDFYDCGYNEEIDPTYKFTSDSPCGNPQLNPTVQVQSACPINQNAYCTMSIIRTPIYKEEGNICYDSRFIDLCKEYKTICSEGETRVDGVCYRIISKEQYNSLKSSIGSEYNSFIGKSQDGYYVKPGISAHNECSQFTQVDDNYYHLYRSGTWSTGIKKSISKTNCTSGEINVDGYCHKINSYAQPVCNDGYQLNGNKCTRKINKTCSKTCTSDNWSSWSEWSTTKVNPSDTVEVQTK